MSEHFTRNTESATKWCNRCGRLRALSSKQDLARLFGQVQLELDRENPQISQRGEA